MRQPVALAMDPRVSLVFYGRETEKIRWILWDYTPLQLEPYSYPLLPII